MRVRYWLLLLALNAAIWMLVVRERATVANMAAVPTTTNNIAKAVPKPLPPIVVRTNAFQWAQLESEDYRTYINRLRSIGCPEQTIRDIVIADLEKLMAPEVRNIEGRHEAPKYWKPKSVGRTLDGLNKIGQKQEVDFRKREIIRELLGVDLAAERSKRLGETDFYEERLSFLTPEKQARVRMAMEKANREEVVLREKSWLENDELTAEERGQLLAIQKAKEGEVAQVLSPDELEQYNLWFSPSAYRVRDWFLVLEPNEQDFLALYQIQREFDKRWDGVDPSVLTAAELADYQNAQKGYDDALREHLGPERFEKLTQTREPDFHQLQDTIAQFGLRREMTGEIYGFKKVLEQERSRIGQTRSIAPEQRKEILRALSEETERAIVEALGPKPYRYYVRSGAGKWIWE